MNLPLAPSSHPPGEHHRDLADEGNPHAHVSDLRSDSEATDDARTPQEIITWAFERFRDRRLVITTGFGMEGCVMIDMIDRALAEATAALPDAHGARFESRPDSILSAFTVSYLDTHFLFPETLALRERLLARYPRLRLENHGTSLTPEAQEALHGPRLWESAPDRCCMLRKVVPMRELLRGGDAWMTAVRREQSETRATIEPVAWDPQFEIVKISPLAAWSRERVWRHVREHDVPYNELHDRGYPSIGCIHCTSPVRGARPDDYTRAGRWAGSTKTECGIHRRP